MRTALVRRTVLPASALSLALLATACGGGSEKPDAKGDAASSAPASASASGPAVKGKTAAELTGLVLTQPDMPDHIVEPATSEEVKAGAEATTGRPECLPLVKAQSVTPIGAASGAARVKVIAKGKGAGPNATEEEKFKAGMDALGSTITAVTLASYDDKGAEAAFASLKTAGTACAAGYDGSAQGETAKFTVAPGAPVTAGDETLSYTLVGDVDGEKVSTELVAVRKGGSLVTFYAVSLAGTAEQPKTVVAAQLKKLG